MNDGRRPPTLLHLAAHPDDELLGAPAALMALRDAGWRVVNLALGLGSSPKHMGRRRAELEEACRRANFELQVAPAAGAPPQPEALRRAELERTVASALARLTPRIVVAPSPHDRHPAHEWVGRAAARAIEGSPAGAGTSRLWLWGLWADLPFPTLATRFGAGRLAEICSALEAHAGELARNDYRKMLRARGQLNASLGPERVFGFGSEGLARGRGGGTYVELLCEVGLSGGRWWLGASRWLDPVRPLAPLGKKDVTGWLSEPSLTERFGL